MTRATMRSPAEGMAEATMMISGSAGITRKTFESADRLSSAAPPRKPALTPIRTDNAVATRPASRPTNITPREPTKTWLKMSCPRCVVPNQCLPDGAWIRSLLRADGSYGATHGPMIAIRQKNASTTRPVAAFGFATNRNRRRLARAPEVTGTSGPSGVTAVMVVVAADTSALLPGTRVEEQVGDVGQQVGHQHRQRDHQEHALHQRVVLGADGLEQVVADPGVGEDDLDQVPAADDEAQRQRETGDVRQQRVAGGVADHHAALGQAFRVRDGDVVLRGDRHHHVAHGQDPAAHRRD